MADITVNGITMEFSVVEKMMDPQLRAEVEATLPGKFKQALLEAYIAEHEARFGKAFLPL
jgi:hypothetical protein